VGDVLAMVREVSPEVEEAGVFDIFTGEKIGDGTRAWGSGKAAIHRQNLDGSGSP